MEAIGLLINPRAKRHRNDTGGALRMARILGDRGVVGECHDQDDLLRVAEDFKRQGVTILAMGGGDGTTGYSLTGFREVYRDEQLPKVALLRGGTMNTVANSIGIPRGQPDDLLRGLVRKVGRCRAVPTVEWSTMLVNGRCSFLAGAGVVHAWLAEYYALGQPYPTRWTAVETFARSVGSTLVQGPMLRRLSRRLRAVVTIDGERWPEEDWFTVAAGTVTQIGLGFRSFPRAEERPDTFHLLGIHGSAIDFTRNLPRVRLGKLIAASTARQVLATHVVVEPAEERIGFMTDGDLGESEGPLTLTVGPRIRVVQ